MTRYLALLRGVNVGGGTTLPMASLRALVAGLGHADVSTYIQTGNVFFTSTVSDAAQVARELERHIAEGLGVKTTVLLRTPDELAQVVAGNPFVGRDVDPARLYVTFLAEAPECERAARLEVPAGVPDQLALIGREVYLSCPTGYGRTKLTGSFLERRLGVPSTTRSWKVTNELLQRLEA